MPAVANGFIIDTITDHEVKDGAEFLKLDPVYAKKWSKEITSHQLSLLVAKSGKEFAGRVCVVWRKPDEEEIAANLPGVPLTMALHVAKSFRRQGVGMQLMQAAEQLVCKRGKTQLCLGVAVDNQPALKLYEKLGYQDWTHGLVTIRWTEPTENGRKEVSELCRVLVKDVTCQ